MNKEKSGKNWLIILFEIVKILATLATLLLAYKVYNDVTKPDSELNTWKWKNENARQQAGLLIELFKEDDVFKLKNGYDIILATQGAIDTTIKLSKIDSMFRERVFEREKTELINAYTDLLIRKAEISRKFDSYDAIGDFTIGESAIAPDISFLENFINLQLKDFEKQLLEHGVNLKSIRYYKEYHDLIN